MGPPTCSGIAIGKSAIESRHHRTVCATHRIELRRQALALGRRPARLRRQRHERRARRRAAGGGRSDALRPHARLLEQGRAAGEVGTMGGERERAGPCKG
eukprot:166622-Prymnesium_polylepis.1